MAPLLSQLKYFINGGKRRWFQKSCAALRTLPLSTTSNGATFRCRNPAWYGETLTVGLEVAPDQALDLFEACDKWMTDGDLNRAFPQSRRAALLDFDPNPCLEVCQLSWRIAKRLKGRDLEQATFNRLASTLAKDPKLEKRLIAHLQEGYDRDLLGPEKFDQVLSDYLEKGKFTECASWKTLLVDFEPTPEIFEVHLLLGHFRECLLLAKSSRQKSELLDGLRGNIESAARTQEWQPAIRFLWQLIQDLDGLSSNLEDWTAFKQDLAKLSNALLMQMRHSYQAEIPSADTQARIEKLRAWSEMEEYIKEYATAAEVLEQTGEVADAEKISQLWEKAGRFDNAARAMNPVLDRPEARGRKATMLLRAGAAAEAAELFEGLGRWEQACFAYEAARQFGAAANCLRQELGDEAALSSLKYGLLQARAGQGEEWLWSAIIRVKEDPGNGEARTMLVQFLREPVEINESLRREACVVLETTLHFYLRQLFEERQADWIARGKGWLRQRYCETWGVDLGTSKCSVSVFDLCESKSVVCPWRGQPEFASTLALDAQGRERVGLEPAELSSPNIVGVIRLSKRSMGLRRALPCGPTSYEPEEVAARLLWHSRCLVESFLEDRLIETIANEARQEIGEELPAEWLEEPAFRRRVKISRPRAIITVPALFDYNQRAATQAAAEIADIELVRLLSEPSATCLDLCQGRKFRGCILIIDLGAGSLDIGVINEFEKVLEVKQVFGDSQLGASDVNTVLVQELESQLTADGIAEWSPLDARRLRYAAEQIKKDLSSCGTATADLYGFAGRECVSLSLTGERLAKLLEPYLVRLADACKSAAACQADHVVLVGGPFLSPILRDKVENLFRGKAKLVARSHESVVCGAAAYAAKLQQGRNADYLLMESTAFALGIQVEKDGVPKIEFLIPRGATIPTSKKHEFATALDFQTSAGIQVFQGSGHSTSLADNTHLGTVILEDIPPARKGETRIDITFDIDANGVITVSAQSQKGTQKGVTLRLDGTTWLSNHQKQTMKRRLVQTAE